MHKHEFTHLVANKQFINARLGPCTERCSHGDQRTDERDSTYSVCCRCLWREKESEITTWNQCNGTCYFWHLRFFYFQLKRFRSSLEWQKHPNSTVSGGFHSTHLWTLGFFGKREVFMKWIIATLFLQAQLQWITIISMNVSNILIKQYLNVLTLHTPTVYSFISQILEIFDKEHAYISFAGPKGYAKGILLRAKCKYERITF